MATKSTSDDDTRGENAAEQQPPPLLKVVSPDATPEEIAALVAVFASLGGTEPEPPRRTPEWAAHHRKVRGPHHHGPGGWRSSGLPR
jgi:hypothetical protein